MKHSAGHCRAGAFAAALLFLSCSSLYAQRYELSLSNGQHVGMNIQKGGFSSVVVKDGKIQSVQKDNPEEIVHLIVTFKDRPLATYRVRKSQLQKNSVALAYEALQASHASFRTALAAIRQQLSTRLKPEHSYTITRDYYRALNGVALQCMRGMINKILALPIVEHISPDKEVKADLTQSVHQIRADIVQDSLGLTGEGVLVGDVDTGIDYDNPALGGGFGPGYRVIGGYDFVNNDNDPMDDVGHGTHVAGIIGANGGNGLRGVAPDVRFLAVKVLDANGTGPESDVIAGIEYCLDPDGNPTTDDAVDVINMSLGGVAASDNPLDSAVANATTAGVLCVVAAGNSGTSGYGWISSPGTSESALTVGACDSADHIADFSSEGPDPLHSAIKPEVVAPGVDILSTILNDQTASWSGTSMATPHVTGTAALLKQEHPSWTPGEIKAAIVNTAHSAGDAVSVFAQGKGRIDALDAAEARMVVAPGVVSFGYTDLARPVWSDTVQLTVRNFRSATENTMISILNGPPSGATLTFDKTAFSLAPGEETTVTAILAVPSSVPILAVEPFAYLGTIRVASDSDNVLVPFGFVKSTTLVIRFDAPPTLWFLVNRVSGELTNLHMLESATKYVVRSISQGDSFDLIAVLERDTLGFQDSYFVHNVIDHPVGLTNVSVSHNEATLDMADDTLYDIHNIRLPVDTSMAADVHIAGGVAGQQTATTYEMLWRVSPGSSRLFSCPLDSLFYITKVVSFPHDSGSYFLRKFAWGLHSRQDIIIATGAGNLFGYHVKSSYDDPSLTRSSLWEKTLVIDVGTLRTPLGGGQSWRQYYYNFPRATNSIFYFNNPAPIQKPADDRSIYSYMHAGASYWPISSDSNAFAPGPTLSTPSFAVNEKGEAVFEQKRVEGWLQGSVEMDTITSAYITQVVKPGDTIKVEQNSHANLPDYLTYVRNGSLYMKDNVDYWDGNSHGGIKQFNGVSECRFVLDPQWNTPRFGVQVFAHNRAQTNMKPFAPVLPGSTYSFDKNFCYYEFDDINDHAGTLHILSDAPPYTLLGQGGQSTAAFTYHIPGNLGDQDVWWTLNLLGASLVFPSFDLLQVSADGKPTDIVRPGQTGVIRLVLFDHDDIVTSANISLLLASGDEIDLPVSYAGGHEYDATVPGYLPTGFVDVLARMEDARGDEITLTASPAFYFGINTDAVRPDARLRMSSYALNNVEAVTMETGDTLDYTLSYVNYGSDIARHVVVKFPTTPYLRPLGADSSTIDSVGVADTVRMPISLIFLGKRQSTDEYTRYRPSIAWTSGGTSYLRRYDLLLDFQNTMTGAVQSQSAGPNEFELYQNYPNPFNPSTTIRYAVPKQSRVTLTVYDILGRKVATLVDEMKNAGSYQAIWDAGRFASGVYFYRLEAGTYRATKKLLLLK